MSTKGYTFLGWIVWQLGSRLARHKLAETRNKVGAAGVILLVLAAGIAAARAGSGD